MNTDINDYYFRQYQVSESAKFTITSRLSIVVDVKVCEN